MKRIITWAFLLTAMYSFGDNNLFSTVLPIPPLLEKTSAVTGLFSFELTAQKGSVSFIDGLETPTYGFNGDFLGPTIRFRRSEMIEIDVINELNEKTTVHWHGLHIPGEMDGGPHQVIEPGAVWKPFFEVAQEAATLWYHPHLLGKTGEQAYKGLAGMIIIDDENSDALAIPKKYGVDDIPLIIQDKRFFENGEFAYVTGTPDIMHGVIGNVVLVNGVHEPYLAVSRGLVRFRLLNGSDSTIHQYTLK